MYFFRSGQFRWCGRKLKIKITKTKDRKTFCSWNYLKYGLTHGSTFFKISGFSKRNDFRISLSRNTLLLLGEKSKSNFLKYSLFDGPLKTFTRCNGFPRFFAMQKPSFPLVFDAFSWVCKKDYVFTFQHFLTFSQKSENIL